MLARFAIVTSLVGSFAACGSSGDVCMTDSECGGDVCARNMECLPAGDVRTVRAAWTIDGVPPTPALCTRYPSLQIIFTGLYVEDNLGFAPVPCAVGLFTVDKLPTRFNYVELGPETGLTVGAVIDGEGRALLDL